MDIVSNANLVSDFQNIKNTHDNVCRIFQEIQQKLMDLNIIYTDVVKEHSFLKEYTFGLDAFYFQSKLIEQEYENMCKLLNCITNRFYCEYYKLYKIIGDYVVSKLSIGKICKTDFPIYKDLDKSINYDFKLTVQIQGIIIQYITNLQAHLEVKQTEMVNNTIKQTSIGINIEHIVHYQYFTNALLAEQIQMFIRYVDTLNKHHLKYINRLYMTSKALIDEVNDDLRTGKDDIQASNDVIQKVDEESVQIAEPLIVQIVELIQTEEPIPNNITIIVSDI